MNVNEFTQILKDPKLLDSKEQTTHLEELLQDYPYFQAAHSLYIKGLKNQNSHKYNKALKEAAARTTDRTILFNFISSEVFNELNEETQKQVQEVVIENESSSENKEELQPIETLIIDQPLEFDRKEMHSFATWLALTSSKPLSQKRDQSKEEKAKKAEDKEDHKRSKKTAQIEAFLQQKPKIKPQKDYTPTIDINLSTSIDEREIMTETLARVYLEQKNYDKAIQAYTILSLKYPEKNSFFAGQIRAIKKRQKDK